jgi:hypothetical protein
MSPEQFIATWLRNFAPQFLNNRKADIFKANRQGEDLYNSGDLLRSLRQDTKTDEPNWQFMMSVYFRLYGRYQDMKRNYRGHAGGSDMIEALKDWAEREGLQRFKNTRRGNDYGDAYEGMSDERLKNAIAWGIVKKYNKQNPKRRKWWNKGKTRDLNKGYRELLKGFRDIVTQNMKEIIEK